MDTHDLIHQMHCILIMPTLYYNIPNTFFRFLARLFLQGTYTKPAGPNHGWPYNHLLLGFLFYFNFGLFAISCYVEYLHLLETGNISLFETQIPVIIFFKISIAIPHSSTFCKNIKVRLYIQFPTSRGYFPNVGTIFYTLAQIFFDFLVAIN